MERIIFLDVDGVLNTNQDAEIAFIDDNLLLRFARLVQRSKAKIVISSSWRKHKHLVQFLCDKLEKIGIRVSDNIIAQTKDLTQYGKNRAQEIQEWMQIYEGCNRIKWVALDDMDLHILEPNYMNNHFVHISPGKGLTVENVDTALQILDVIDSEDISSNMESCYGCYAPAQQPCDFFVVFNIEQIETPGVEGDFYMRTALVDTKSNHIVSTLAENVCMKTNDSTKITLRHVLMRFDDWIRKHTVNLARTFYLVVFGDFDLKELLPLYCQEWSCPLPMYFLEWIDLQKLYGEWRSTDTSICSIKNILEWEKICISKIHSQGTTISQGLLIF